MGETRELLLQAATAEFASQGYAGANINRISRSAGFAKGTVYNYFPSKRALMLALIQEVAGSHLATMEEQVLQPDSPSLRLKRFFQAGFAWVKANPQQAQVMVTTLNGPDPEFKLAMFEAYHPMFQLVGRDIVAAGIAAKSLRPLDPESTARLLMTIYLGVASRVDQAGDPWFSADQLADLLLDGLRRRPEGPPGERT
jgi:AcrR family transcriptional regulator